MKSTGTGAGLDIMKSGLKSVAYTSGIIVAVLLWATAGIYLCGIYGCSNGGFEVDTNSIMALGALILSGVATSMTPFITTLKTTYKRRWYIITIVTFSITVLLGMVVIDAVFSVG